MPLLETKGAGSAQGFGLSLGGEEAVYVEDVFSTYLYTGVGSAITIVNGIDLAGDGGLVWLKNRGTVSNHSLHDTTRTPSYQLSSNTTAAQDTVNGDLSSFNSNGFTIGTSGGGNNRTGDIASWTFRKQPKFFDVVTWTGDGVGGFRTLNHSLGAEPGLIIVKSTSIGQNWYVYHRSAGTDKVLYLNTTAAQQSVDPGENAWATTSTTFSINNTQLGGNTNGATYVAYLFAHDAGGFGLTGLDNVISCGSFTTSGGSAATVTLGYEPQWVLIKSTDNSDSWFILDNMRGWVTGGNDARLIPNTSAAEDAGGNYGNITATGFQAAGAYYASSNHIYIAIRRGPMKVPTSGTEVFAPALANGLPRYLTNFVTDLTIQDARDSGSNAVYSRLTGTNALRTTSTDAEFASSWAWDLMNGSGPNFASTNYIGWNFKRAPGFFDEVCYTGNGVAGTAITHNLGVAPELLIVKSRSLGDEDWVACCSLASSSPDRRLLRPNTQAAGASLNNYFSDGSGTPLLPTSSVFSVGSNGTVNTNAQTYVAYLFATLAGVSKVGSYTGTGTTQVINCGFTAGARFVLIKRTDSTGDWYVWDSARGIVSGNDPYLLLNSTAAEVTNTDYVDTASTGFEISSTAPAAINANGGTFIFLAIA